jgi:hypothetical protein
MTVDDRRALADHNAARKRHQHDVTGLGEIRCGAVGPDRLVKDVFGDAIEQGGIIGMKPDNLESYIAGCDFHDGFVKFL